MGSCSSNDVKNGGQGFNDGDNGESQRPNSRQAGNMAPNPEQPKPTEAEASSANPVENAVPQGNLVSPQFGSTANPTQEPANGQGRPWIDFDPRTGKPMLGAGHVGAQEANIPLDNAEANRRAFEAAAGSAISAQPDGVLAQRMDQYMPPQAHMAHGNPLIIGAVSADVSDGRIVSDGHWEEFEAANNVMSLEDYQKSL